MIHAGLQEVAYAHWHWICWPECRLQRQPEGLDGALHRAACALLPAAAPHAVSSAALPAKLCVTAARPASGRIGWSTSRSACACGRRRWQRQQQGRRQRVPQSEDEQSRNPALTDFNCMLEQLHIVFFCQYCNTHFVRGCDGRVLMPRSRQRSTGVDTQDLIRAIGQRAQSISSMAAAIGPCSRVGLAHPLPGVRARACRALLQPRRALHVCVTRQRRLGRTAATIAAMAAPPAWPAAAAAAAGGGGALGTFALAGIVMAALLALAASWQRCNSDLFKIPGPKQLPLLGNLAELGHPQAHQTIVDFANKFGSLVRWAGSECYSSSYRLHLAPWDDGANESRHDWPAW